MTHLLDTNACIAHLRSAGASPVSRRLAAAAPGSVVLYSVVRAELLFGAMHSAHASRNVPQVTAFLAGFDSLPFDDAAADQHARIHVELD